MQGEENSGDEREDEDEDERRVNMESEESREGDGGEEKWCGGQHCLEILNT